MAKKKGYPKKIVNKKKDKELKTKYPGFKLDPNNILHRVNRTWTGGFEIEIQETLPEASKLEEEREDDKKVEADGEEVEDGAVRQVFPDTGLDDARQIMARNPAFDLESALKLIGLLGMEKALEKCPDLTPVSIAPDWTIRMTGSRDDLAPALKWRERRHPELTRALSRPQQQNYALDHKRLRGVGYSHIVIDDKLGQEEALTGGIPMSIAGRSRNGRVIKMEIRKEPPEIVAESQLESTRPTDRNARSIKMEVKKEPIGIENDSQFQIDSLIGNIFRNNKKDIEQEPVKIDDNVHFLITRPTARNARSIKLEIKQEPVEVDDDIQFLSTRLAARNARRIKTEIKLEPAEIESNPQFQHRPHPSEWEPLADNMVENFGTNSKTKTGKKIKKEPLDEMEGAVSSQDVIFEGYNLRKKVRVNYNPSMRQIKIKKEEPDTHAKETVETHVDVVEKRVTRAALRNNQALKLHDSGWERIGKNNVSYPSPPLGHRKKTIKKEPVDESPKKMKTIESVSYPSPPLGRHKRAIKKEPVDEPPKKMKPVERIPIADTRSNARVREDADFIRQVARDFRREVPPPRDPDTPCSSAKADELDGEYERTWRNYNEFMEGNGLTEEDL